VGRWRKLIFNACLNPICAITGLDDARIRLAPGVADALVKPVMREIFATATKLGHVLPEDIMDTMLNMDPMDLYLKPSMQVDIEKVCFPSRFDCGGEGIQLIVCQGKLYGI
jgi:ketopantoate reductase